MTPLHVAAERGYLKIVEYLVSKEADIDIQDNNGVILFVIFSVTMWYCLFQFELASYFYSSIEF